MVEALVVALAVVIGGVLVYWFVFRWEATPKRWCVMFYLTSNTPASAAVVNRPDAETGIPPASAGPAAATLDDKLDQVVGVIRSLPCATAAGIAAQPEWDDVYVVYRAIWDDPLAPPEARVVRPGSSAPTKTYFPGETIFDVGYSIDFTKDLTLFFEWAYENCPAQQYAVFFWGHAIGPAGFLQPGEKPQVVSPLVAFLMKIVFFLTGSRWSGNLDARAISDAIESIVKRRIKDDSLPRQTDAPPGALPPPGGGAAGDAGGSIVFTVGQPVPKVDVVLFQDCWMATLETAFELQDAARYLVASQSLVPAGFAPGQQLGAVWPYERLISILLQPAPFAAPVMQELKDFFDGIGPHATSIPGYNRYPATKVLFSLLDCGTTAGFVSSALRTEFQALVQSLYPLGPQGRSALIELSFEKAGRLFELQGVQLLVGDQALIDLLTLCTFLQAPAQWPAALVVSLPDRNAIVAAAAALRPRIAALVTSGFQSPPYVPGEYVYTGAAALYKPFAIWGDDPYIVHAFRAPYETLRFSKETLVTPPPAGGTAECSWTEYAFDRYRWI
jgi:hypothetical protein